MSDSEAVLIRRCQAGDREAFGVIVKRYAGAAQGVASLLLRSRDDALDASQDAFVRAWRHIRQFEAGRPFYPWYAAILRNVCMSRLRERTRHRAADLPVGQADPHDSADPVLLAERNERRDRVWRAIQSLSDERREIIVMSHFQGLSYKDMAAALGVPIGTVMSRLHNARRALRDRLVGEEP